MCVSLRGAVGKLLSSSIESCGVLIWLDLVRTRVPPASWEGGEDSALH